MPPYTDRQQHDIVAAAQHGQGPADTVMPVMLDHLFMGLIRSPRFLDEARLLINPNQFHPMAEPHFALLWNVLISLRDRFDEYKREDVITECHRFLAANPGCMLPQHQELLLRPDQYGLIFTAFGLSSVNLPYCRGILEEFLRERTVAGPLRRFMDSVAVGQYPRGLDEFLGRVTQQAERIRGIQALPRVTTVPELHTELEAPSTFHSTGLEWLDSRIGGGLREGDAIGILGVTGAGKSTLAAHLASSIANRAFVESMMRGNPQPDLTAFLTYEESAMKMRPRLWSAAMKIRRSKLETLTRPWEQLSGPHNMEEYERAMQPQNGEQLCEQQRWEEGRLWLNKSLDIFDMSGSNEFPYAGTGYIQEIVTTLDSRCQALGVGIRSVVVDYAGLVAKRHMGMQDIAEDRLRHFLARFGDDIRRFVAEKFHCSVIIMHQIAAQEGNRNPTALLNHTMASESKSFAENLAICASMGVPDPLTGCRLMNFSKCRTAPVEQIRPVTLRINDEFAMLEDVGSRFVINESGRGFVTRDLSNRLHGGGPAMPISAAPTAATQSTSAGDIVDGVSPPRGIAPGT